MRHTCAIAMLLAAGCAPRVMRSRVAITPASVLCKEAGLTPKSFCLPALAIEALLRRGAMSIVLASPPKHFSSGAQVMVIEFPTDAVVIKAKWKQARLGATGLYGEARKELAAYAFQKLFLEPAEYVVPPTVGRCIPLDFYKSDVKTAKPTFEGTDCVLGVLSYWLEDMQELKGVDRERFAENASYRGTVANMNLLTHLIEHRDTRPSNFLVSNDPDHPRAFAVDNDLAFSGVHNPRALFVREWVKIIVPSLPHQQIDRLRTITRAELDELAVVAQFAIHGRQLDEVEPTAPIAPREGVRRAGDIIQLGLTTSEIDGIEERLKELLRAADAGKVQLF